MKALFLDDEQCTLLREMLDFVPLKPRYLPLIVDLLQRIPESDAQSVGADRSPAPLKVPGVAGGVNFISHTYEGTVLLAMLERVLPHGGSL